MYPVIAFVGPIGCGKTTAAKYLVEKYCYTLCKFAQPLRGMLWSMGLTEEQTDGDLKEVPSDLLCGKTPRYAMQTLGVEWGREMIGGSLWVNVWRERIERLELVVVDDCRFPDEAYAVRSLGGIAVKIYRPGLVSQDHSSESSARLVLGDYILDNLGPVKQTYEWLDKLIEGKLG